MNVIMFHSVGLRRLDWVSPQIAEDVAPFLGKLRAIDKVGRPTYFFREEEVHDLESDHPGTCLTFDDGYLDNWVHVFPALRRLGMKATIFMTTDFIDPREERRECVDDATLRDDRHDAARCCAGFLSWPEMREMESSGLVEIQSHAKTHTWYPSGPEIVDFWRPGSATRLAGPVWMLWNAFPEEKPHYLTRAAEMESRIPWGTPIYAHEKSLSVRRWIPDEAALERGLCDFVEERGGREFFDRADWRRTLMNEVERRRGSAPPAGRHETQEEWLARVDEELRGSKEILERGLSREIDCIAWPGGGVTEPLFDRARMAGYRRFTRPQGISQPGIPPRLGSVPRLYYKGRDIGHPSQREFEWILRYSRGERRYRLPMRVSRVLRLMLAPLGVWE